MPEAIDYKSPERPKNALHKLSEAINFPLQVFKLLDEGFATATNFISQALPSFPAAFMGCPAIGGSHAHTLHPPSGPAPIPPTPLPSFGNILFGTCLQVLINGIPAARCGDLGLTFTCFGLPPLFEVFTGSSKVFIGGARAARMSDFTYHCKMSNDAAKRKLEKYMDMAGTAMKAAGFAAQGLSIAGDIVESAEADDSDMSAALGLNATMMTAQMANDLVAMALEKLMGKDLCVPPGSLGVIILGSPNVLIGGFPMPSWINIAKGLMKMVKGLKRRNKGTGGKADSG